MTREEAIDIIRNYDVNGCGYCHQGGNEIEEAFEMAIKALEPKTGYWIRGKYTEDDIRYNDSSYKCSECNRVVDFKEDFCPKCGAKMIET